MGDFGFRKNLDSNAAYNSISMGIPQIMGFHATSLGYSSAEKMLRDFVSGNESQIRVFFKHISGDSNMDNSFKSNTAQNLATIATKYNGGGDNAT